MSLKSFVKLRKQGNSLVVTIPKRLLEALGWKEGDYVLVEVKRLNKKENKSFYDHVLPLAFVVTKPKIEEKE